MFEARPLLHGQYTAGFVGLIIIDECHRGSARDESTRRELLTRFEPAHQVGLCAKQGLAVS